MRCELRAGAELWVRTREHLLGSTQERMAYLLARAGRWRAVNGVEVLDLLVVRALPVPDSALTMQSSVRVEIDPGFTREVLVACYEGGLSLVDVHTHPFAVDRVAFSGQDVANMRTTHAEFLRSVPDRPPVGVASLVVGQDSVAGSFTDPVSGRLRPIDRFTVLGEQMVEVALCC